MNNVKTDNMNKREVANTLKNMRIGETEVFPITQVNSINTQKYRIAQQDDSYIFTTKTVGKTMEVTRIKYRENPKEKLFLQWIKEGKKCETGGKEYVLFKAIFYPKDEINAKINFRKWQSIMKRKHGVELVRNGSLYCFSYA